MPGIIGDRKLANNEKATLIAEVRTAQNEPGIKSMLKLVDYLVEEIRVLNDTAEENDIYRNQGSIRALSVLKEYVLRDMPAINIK